MQRLYLLFLVLAVAACNHATGQMQVGQVVDSQGNPIHEFEILFHTADEGYTRWNPGSAGKWSVPLVYRDAKVVDAIVRADDYASRVVRFEGESLKQLMASESTITLEVGREVHVDVDLPDGMSIPEDVVIESWHVPLDWRVRMMWQPGNAHAHTVDFNMLNVRRSGETQFVIRVPESTDEFYLAFSKAGWLRCCRLGPFSANDVAADQLKVSLPEPCALDVTLVATGDRSALPFQTAVCTVYRTNPGSDSIQAVSEFGESLALGEPFRLTDLAPGEYMVQVHTVPVSDVEEIRDSRGHGLGINPGRFAGRQVATLESGESASLKIDWVPFDRELWRGNANADIHVLNCDGTVPAGEMVRVLWYDGHYGGLPVLEKELPASGVIELRGVTSINHEVTSSFGAYTLMVGSERIGFFDLDNTPDTQPLEFRIAPRVGDVAPDLTLVSVENAQPVQLHDLRGKAVLIEFWSIGCGPCQPAMTKLNRLVEENRAAWGDRVEVISLSTDGDADAVARHADSRGWSSLAHFISTGQDDGWGSDAERRYGVMGIPEAVLIDQTGKIVWRGHPMEAPIESRIEELLR